MMVTDGVSYLKPWAFITFSTYGKKIFFLAEYRKKFNGNVFVDAIAIIFLFETVYSEVMFFSL